MKTKQNRVVGVLFLAVTMVMVLFNSCDKYETTYSVNNSKCALCLSCISVCGQHAISLESDGTTQYVKIDQDKCIGCGKCYNACSYKAISSN